jgi:hypothetical protein
VKRIFFLGLLTILTVSIGFSDTLEGYKRVALVIGNSSYNVAPLANPVNDATDVSDLLQNQGFEVTRLLDTDRRALVDGIRQFGNKLDNKTVALFYYAGHAIQLNGQNYLIPVNAPIQREEDVEFEAVSVDRVIRAMEDNKAYMNLVFLDACRDNPFVSSSRSASRGLSVVAVDVQPETAGAMIAFATAPGSTAADGDGRNGLFTQAFLKYAREPGLEINQMLLRVRSEVLTVSGGDQIPWTDISLVKEFYFAGKVGAEGVLATDTSITPSTLPLESGEPQLAQGEMSPLELGLIIGGGVSAAFAGWSFYSGTQNYAQYQAETNPNSILRLRDQLAFDSAMTWTFGSIALTSIATGTILYFLGE